MTGVMVITAENVRQALGIEHELPAEAASLYFEVLRDILLERGDAEPADRPPGSGLPARLPRSAIIIRGGLPSKDEALLLVAAVGLLPPTVELAVGAVLALVGRLRRLDAGLGELSVIEVLGKELHTSQELHQHLYHRACPHLQANCVFLNEDGRCEITRQSVEGVLEKLSQRELVERVVMAHEDMWRFSG